MSMSQRRAPNFRGWILAVGLAVSIAQEAHTADSPALGLPQEPGTIPDNRQPISLYSVNGVNYFSGDYRYAIPLALPAAKGDLRPDLALEYRSSRSRTGLGDGWNLQGLASVSRSLRHGVPRYRGPDGSHREDELQFRIGEVEGFLAFIGEEPAASGILLYRPVVDSGTMLKFYFDPNAQAGGTWRIYSKDGVVWTLAQHDENSDGTKVFGWHVTAMRDPDGNEVRYSYLTGHPSLPSAIEWDLNAYGPGRSSRVDFIWQDMDRMPCFVSSPPGVHHLENDYLRSYRKGFASDEGRKALEQIWVTGYNETGNPFRLVHRIDYTSTKTFGTLNGGRIAGSMNIGTFTPASPLPPTSFEYWDLAEGFSEVQTVADPEPDSVYGVRFDQFSLEASGPGRTINKLVDMDGDGDLDILTLESEWDYAPLSGVSGNAWKWRENETRDFSSLSEYKAIGLPSHCGTVRSWEEGRDTTRGCSRNALERSVEFKDSTQDYACSEGRRKRRWHQRILDLTGDGAADLAYVDKNPTTGEWEIQVCRGSENPVTGEREFSRCSPWLWTSEAIGLKEEISVFRDPSHEASCAGLVNGELPQHWSWIERDLIDITGDGSPDFVTATASTRGRAAMTLLNTLTNVGTGFVDLDADVHAPLCDEIPPFTTWLYREDNQPPACISSTFVDTWSRRENAVNGDEYNEDVRCTTRSLMDMNGDGIPDLVRTDPATRIGRYRTGYCDGLCNFNPVVKVDVLTADGFCEQKSDASFRFHLGTTEGFETTPRTGLPAGTVVMMSHTKSPHTTGVEGEKVEGVSEGQLFDINGDRIPDWVASVNRNTQALVARLGTGRGFGPLRTWSLCGSGDCGFDDDGNAGLTRGFGVSSCSDGYTGPVIVGGRSIVSRGFYDLDGDGQVEFINIPSNAGSYPCTDTPWQIYRATLSGGDRRLRTVTGGSGFETEVTYRIPNEYRTAVPFPKWVASEITHTDAVTNTPRKIHIAYGTGYFDTTDREFRGFARVQVLHAGTKEVHHYLQGYRDKGHPSKLEVRHRSMPQDLLSRTEWDWQDYGLGGHSWVRLLEKRDFLYTGDGEDYLTSSVTHVYRPHAATSESCDRDWNRLGLVWKTIHNDDLTGADDRRVDEFDYTCNVISNSTYLVKLGREERYDSGTPPRLMSRTSYLYDDQCGTPREKPTRGKLCRRSVWTGNGTADTSYTYDAYGRVAKVTEPDGDYVETHYHDALGPTPYVRFVRNNLNHQTHYRRYHGISGAAGTTCGPQYVTDVRTDKCEDQFFDDYGRVTRIERPQDNEAREHRYGTVARGEWMHFGPYTVSDVTGSAVLVRMTPESGDADLCVSQDAQAASPRDCDCLPFAGGTTEETCRMAAGRTYYVSVGGYARSSEFDLEVTTRRGTDPFSAPTLVTGITYKDDGAFEDPASLTVRNFPGGDDQETVDITYFSGNGQVVLEESSHGAQNASSKKYYVYDELGRLTRAYRPELGVLGFGYDPAEMTGHPYSYEYDALNRVTSITNPDGSVEHRSYDVNSDGSTTTTFTDEESNEVYVTKNRYGEVIEKKKSTGSQVLVSTYRYSAVGHLIEATDPEMGRHQFFHNPDGTLQYSFIQAGPSTMDYASYLWTPGGRLSAKYTYGAKAVLYRYDAIGRLSKRSVQRGPGAFDVDATQDDYLYYDEDPRYVGYLTRVQSVSSGPDRSHRYRRRFEYDARGEISHIFQKDLDGGRKLSLDARSNRLGERRRTIYPDGTSVAYRRDASGSVASVLGERGLNLSVRVTYEADGQVRNVSGSLGSLDFDREFSYDRRGRRLGLSGITGGIQFGTVQDYLRNDRVEWRYDHWDSESRMRTFEYDGAGRLTRAAGYTHVGPWNVGNGSGGSITYSYHKNDALDRVDYENGRSEVYSYATPYRQRVSRVATNYEGTWSYGYDPDGNRTTSNTATYYWYGDGRLARVSYRGWVAAENYYHYTYDGDRWKAVRDGVGTWYLGSLEFDGATGELRKYIQLPDIRCSVGSSSKCHFSDGSNYIATFDHTGALLEKKEFLPYGQENVTSGIWEKIGYDDGKEQEPWFADGVYFVGSRYYDHKLRQFISVDPMRREGVADTIDGLNSLQPYAYAAGDPISLRDPDGRQPVKQVIDFENPPQFELVGATEEEQKAIIAADTNNMKPFEVMEYVYQWGYHGYQLPFEAHAKLMEAELKVMQALRKRHARVPVWSRDGRVRTQARNDAWELYKRWKAESSAVRGMFIGAAWFHFTGQASFANWLNGILGSGAFTSGAAARNVAAANSLGAAPAEQTPRPRPRSAFVRKK